MKTTVDITDSLLREVRRYAMGHGLTLKQVLDNVLRTFLREHKSKAKGFQLRKHAFKGNGLVEGVSEGDWNEVRNRIYEGRGGS